MRRASGGKHVPGGDQIFRRIYTRLGCEGRPPHFMVEYYPYAGLTHTIRLREDTAHVRISDVFRNAPRVAIEAIAAVLLGRLYRRRPPAESVNQYRRFAYAERTRRRLLALRRMRASKSEDGAAGQHHNLDVLFELLNSRYFAESLPRPRLGWSKRTWRRQLGCFDSALNRILLNRQLDKPEVPVFVVGYVLYHELLHVKHPTQYGDCRRTSHSRAFRREEEKFEDYLRAQRFLASFR